MTALRVGKYIAGITAAGLGIYGAWQIYNKKPKSCPLLLSAANCTLACVLKEPTNLFGEIGKSSSAKQIIGQNIDASIVCGIAGVSAIGAGVIGGLEKDVKDELIIGGCVTLASSIAVVFANYSTYCKIVEYINKADGDTWFVKTVTTVLADTSKPKVLLVGIGIVVLCSTIIYIYKSHEKNGES